MTKFDCSKFLDKCHACCCGIVPLEKGFYEANKDKIANKPVEITDFHGPDPFDKAKEKDFIVPITKDMKCGLLKDDYKCAIYEDRPTIGGCLEQQGVDTCRLRPAWGSVRMI